MADPNDPWAAFNPQSHPAAPAFGTRPVIQEAPPHPSPQTSAQAEHDQLTNDLLRRNLAKPDGQQPKPLPPAAASGIQANLENLRAVDAAIAALTARPQSIGPGTGMLGDTFTQFNDPEGTDTRARVGKIGAVTIHDLSGAAVSATEAPRFQPFVPTPQDRPEVALDKLTKFREALHSQIKESLDYYGPSNGYLPYKTPQADQFLQAPPDPTQTERGFGLQAPHTAPLPKAAEEFRNGLYGAMRSGQIKSPSDMQAWVQQFNEQNQTNFTPQLGTRETVLAIRAARTGRPFNVELPQYHPDISDVRGGKNTSGQDAFNASVRGGLDTPSFGAIDKVVAGADTLFKGGTMDENLARQYAISDYDQKNHPLARFGGQAAGAALIPMGEMASIPQIVGKSAGMGAAYGALSSRSLADVPVNALLGAGSGAAVGVGLGAGGRAIGALRGTAKDIPPLVDPATGALNEPLEAMRPGQRVAAAKGYGIDLPMGAATDRGGAIIEKGLDILPGSAGAMNDARRVAEAQATNAVQDVAGKFGSSRTLSEGGAEMQAAAAQRIERGKTVISKAYDAIPIADTAQTSNSSTVATLKELVGRFSSNADLADEMRDPKLLRYLNAIDKGGLSWKDLKDFRTIIGEKIGDMRFGEGHSTSDLRHLYAGLSEDMRNTAASMGPRASRAFERANTLNRQNQELIDGALTRILGPDGQMSPEKAASVIQSMTKGGKSTGDLKTLAQIRGATVKSGAWDEIAATLIRLGGQPANSPGRAFNSQTFLQWYADMAEPARKMLFSGKNGELRSALDGFVAVAQRLAGTNALRNTSQSAPGIMAGSTVAALGAAVLNPLLGAKIVAGMGANYVMAKLWTSPQIVRWLTGYAKAQASGNAAAVQSQAGRLSKIVAANPSLREPLETLMRSIANDNSMRAAAASDSNTQERQ